jgi:hypothetical protein
MDIFEKQQRIDSIKGIIKARWFMIAIIIVLGLILKAKFFGGLWGNFFDIIKIIGIGLAAFCCNFVYWLIVRKPTDEISATTLNVITAMQVVVDQLLYTLIYYYTGTIETIAFLLYYLTILVASSLYKTRGIILTGVLAVFLYSGATLADYYRIVPHVYPLVGQTQTGWFGNLFMTRVKIVGFAFYTGAAIFFSVFLSALIRDRETGLRQQRDQLTDKTRLLTTETRELAKTRDYLHEALTKSDKSRAELMAAQKQLEAKIRELEKYGEVTTGREIKMIELKEKIKNLEEVVKDLQTQVAIQQKNNG